MRHTLLPTLLLCTGLGMAQSNDTNPLYEEPLRPQYHFSPAHRWIGDPCGLVHFDGRFHAYSWGAAESDDLVHWEEINSNAISGTPKGIGQFTGSVVVDRWNSAGYGENAFIAAFTSFDEASKKQSQSIAHSHDGGRTFMYYDLNPVIDTWSTEFRDPTVIRDEAHGRWVMAVAKALEKKVAFYGSADLKHWEWLSDFGPAGDSEKSWECPDLFQLPVEGHPGMKKWVLVVSVNWSKEQYFTGEFDGTQFIPDCRDCGPLYVDKGLDYYASRTFQDYDGTLPAAYSIGWVSTWDYAQHVPTTYGQGVWSLPRALYLRETPGGLRLIQKPAEKLKSLRGKEGRIRTRLKPGATRLKALSEMGNQYEIRASFTTDTFGFNLCAGDGKKLTLSYDTDSHTLLLDRTNSSAAEIPAFERIAFTKIEPIDGTLELDIFVDKSVVEIYANGGEAVMTALVFPDEAKSSGAEVFSLGSNTTMTAYYYPISSIWK